MAIVLTGAANTGSVSSPTISTLALHNAVAGRLQIIRVRMFSVSGPPTSSMSGWTLIARVSRSTTTENLIAGGPPDYVTSEWWWRWAPSSGANTATGTMTGGGSWQIKSLSFSGVIAPPIASSVVTGGRNSGGTPRSETLSSYTSARKAAIFYDLNAFQFSEPIVMGDGAHYAVGSTLPEIGRGSFSWSVSMPGTTGLWNSVLFALREQPDIGGWLVGAVGWGP